MKYIFMKAKFITLFAVSMVSFSWPCFSDASGSASPQEVSRSMIGYFQPVDSLEFEVAKSVDVLKDAKKSYTEKLKYSAKGKRYKYIFTSETNDGGVEDCRTISFDGARGYSLIDSNGELIISTERPRDINLSNMQGFLEPFAFFLAKDDDGSKKGAFIFPTLEDYKERANWGAIIEKLAMAPVVRHGQEEAICITLPGGLMPWKSVGTTFKVFLSKKHGFFPIAWERTAVDGSFRYVYEINSFRTISLPNGKTGVIYPELATMKKYVDNKETPNYIATIRVSNVSINNLKDEDWTIDPALAKFIMDKTVDPPTLIAIPR